MESLLAVDLGLRTGLALYRRDGRLAWYRSHHYASRAALRRAVAGLLDANPGVARAVLEGGGPIAEVWADACAFRGVVVRRVSAEAWRALVFDPRERSDGPRAKRSADALARRVIA